MSSGFVSGGTNEAPKERDAEWLQAQKDLETLRREKEEAATQEGGKSLYEILQANKGDLHDFLLPLHATSVLRIRLSGFEALRSQPIPDYS